MKSITVRTPKTLNLEQSQKVLESVLKKGGHPFCLSGLNIYFENAVDPEDRLMIVEEAGQKVVEVGG